MEVEGLSNGQKCKEGNRKYNQQAKDTVFKETADFSEAMRRKFFKFPVVTELRIIGTHSYNLVIFLTLQRY